jgi:hypothetical protein
MASLRGLTPALVVLAFGACLTHPNHRQASNAAVTLGMFDRLFDALALFAERCGGYPADLGALEAPEKGVPSTCAHLGTFAEAVKAEGIYREGDELGMFISSVNELPKLRESGAYRGYRIRYSPQQPQSDGLFRAYALSADPVERQVTGFRSFWMSEAGDIHCNDTAAAGPTDPILRAALKRRPTRR